MTCIVFPASLILNCRYVLFDLLKVYSLDWLGVGLSTRPTWPANGQDPAVAEAFFADSLEEVCSEKMKRYSCLCFLYGWSKESFISPFCCVIHCFVCKFVVRHTCESLFGCNFFSSRFCLFSSFFSFFLLNFLLFCIARKCISVASRDGH